MPRVVHFEINAEEPARAVEFYRSVFGWSIEKWDGPEDYWLITTGQQQPGINGGLLKRLSPGASVVNSIDVTSVEESVESIARHGGRVLTPKMTITGVGYLAYFQDPEGNVFGIFQDDKNARS